MASIRELIIKARVGDAGAFEEIVEKYRDMAVGYAYAVLNDYHLAEDAAQEAFFLAYFKLDTLISPEAFLPWFKKIVYSRCERVYRKKRPVTVPLENITAARDPGRQPVEAAESGELRRTIHNAVSTLPERRRTAAVLCLIGGYTMAEAARFLDLPIGTVKSRLFAARKTLRASLADSAFEISGAIKTNIKFTEKVMDMIITGNKQTLYVKDGIVTSWGNASRKRQNGSSDTGPSAVEGLTGVKSAATTAGCYGSFALLEDGSVWAWGWNVFKHLGTGSDEEYIFTPEQVRGITGAAAVAAGVAHALALTEGGSVYAWGRNWYGQLGNGVSHGADRKYEDSDYPAEIKSLNEIVQISAGFFHSLALCADGTAWRWGGYGDSRFTFPIAYETNKPAKIKIKGRVRAISAGGMHSLFLMHDGTVWACGYNTLRQLGTNKVYNEIIDAPVQVGGLTDIIKISAGGGFSLALKKDGSVWAWGCNANGEHGSGVINPKTEMELNDLKSEPVRVSVLQNAVDVAAGGSHAMAVTEDGGVWIWGNNDEGQLGDNTKANDSVPRRIAL